jgi:hypothetical protein
LFSMLRMTAADYHENDRQSQASENAIIGYRMFDIQPCVCGDTHTQRECGGGLWGSPDYQGDSD